MALTDTARAMLLEVETRRRRKVFDLPDSGQISAGDINEELGRPTISQFNIGGEEERALAGVASGEISFSDFHGKSADQHIIPQGGTPTATTLGFWQGMWGEMNPQIFEFTEGNFSCFQYVGNQFSSLAFITLVGSHAATNANLLQTDLEITQGSNTYTTYFFERSSGDVDSWIIRGGSAFTNHLISGRDDRLRVFMNFTSNIMTPVQGINWLGFSTLFEPGLGNLVPIACPTYDANITDLLVLTAGPTGARIQFNIPHGGIAGTLTFNNGTQSIQLANNQGSTTILGNTDQGQSQIFRNWMQSIAGGSGPVSFVKNV